MAGFWDYNENDLEAHPNGPLTNTPGPIDNTGVAGPDPMHGGGLATAPAGTLPPGAPPGAVATPGGGWVVYGANGQVVSGGGPGNGAGGAQGAPGAPGAAGGSPTDRNFVRQQLATLMQQHGVTPGPRGSGPADLEYYTDQAMNTGGWTADNAGYWTGRWQSDAKGGSGGAPGAVGAAAGSLGSAMGGGDLLAPYTQQFHAPVGTDDPGFQFAVQQGQQGIERSAAAKGTLLTGGTLKDLAGYTTGMALQDYNGAYNRALDTFKTNYGIFTDNQDRPFSKLYQTSALGLNAANSYAGNLGSNLGNGLNASSSYATNAANLANNTGALNAQGQLSHGNTLQNYAALGTNLAGTWYQSHNQGAGA